MPRLLLLQELPLDLSPTPWTDWLLPMCSEGKCNKRKLWVKGAKSGQMLKAQSFSEGTKCNCWIILCSHWRLSGTANVTVLPKEFRTENGNNPAEINTGKRYFFVYLSKHKTIHCKFHQGCVTSLSMIRFLPFTKPYLPGRST